MHDKELEKEIEALHRKVIEINYKLYFLMGVLLERNKKEGNYNE